MELLNTSAARIMKCMLDVRYEKRDKWYMLFLGKKEMKLFHLNVIQTMFEACTSLH